MNSHPSSSQLGSSLCDSLKTLSGRHVVIVAPPPLWPNIKRPGWWKETMTHADKPINQVPTQRGAGLGPDMTTFRPEPQFTCSVQTSARHPVLDLLIMFICFTECASRFISRTCWFLSVFIFYPAMLFSCPLLLLFFLSVSPSFCLLPAHFNEECCIITCYLYRKCV